MKKKRFIKIVFAVFILIILLFIITIVFLTPWLDGKIKSALSNQDSAYTIEYAKTHVILFNREIKLESVSINTKNPVPDKNELTAHIDDISFKGINIFKLIFNNDLNIREIIIKEPQASGTIPFKVDSVKAVLMPLNLELGKLVLDNLSFSIKDTSSPKSYVIKNGDLEFTGIHISKNDTLSKNVLKQMDIKLPFFSTITADSLYTLTVRQFEYSGEKGILSIDSFYSHPNYEGYDFTNRKEFVTSRMDAAVGDIILHDFNLPGLIDSGELISSYVEIGDLALKVFKDGRKKIKHVERPMLQEMIYSYPGRLQIDSLFINSGNIIYTEHALKAASPGTVTFKKVESRIYNINSDTLQQSKDSWLEINAGCDFMGTGKLDVTLRAKYGDGSNLFIFRGSLGAMQVDDLNPIIEKNAGLSANKGMIDKMKFNLSGNNFNSSGDLLLLYHDLTLDMEIKDLEEKSEVKELIISFIANLKIKNANPLPGQEVRKGEIYFERDKERYIINYCFKSVLSGVLSTIINVKDTPEKPKRKGE